MKLVITEKPSVAQTIAAVLGVSNTKSGYIEGNEYLVSWCFGHLIGLAPPDYYDAKYADKQWKFEDLPIMPAQWKFVVNQATKSQYELLKSLMFRNDVTEIICATDLEQRRGRIVRQGNQNKQVHLYRYVTKGTFDAYSYQLLENKQKFISQIITSKSPARKCSDVDQEALTYAEIKALCTADERIKEQLMLNNRVKELKMLKSEYTNTHYELEDKVIAYPAERESLCKRISNIASDFERCKQIPLGADGLPVFELRIGNIIYTDRKEAAKALESACNKTIAQRIDKIETVGSIYGFDFALTFEKNGQPANAVILGSESYNISLNSIGHYSLNKLEKAIFSIEKQLNLHQEQLNKLDTDIDSAKKILDKPFEFEDELSEKETRLFDLTKELKEEQVRAAKQDIKKERTHYFGKDKILGCFRKNNPKKNDMPEKSKDEVSR